MSFKSGFESRQRVAL